MAPSTKSLSQILNDMVFKKLVPNLIHDHGQTPWNGPHILALLCYIIKFGFKSKHGVLSDTVSHLDDIASNHVRDNDRYEKFFKAVVSLMPELQKFFRVPKLPQLSDSNPKKNELLAAFIDFLLQILECKPDWIVSVEDKIATLQKELKFLVTVLGDTPLRCTELEVVKTLLNEFEDVANAAGDMVDSFFFTRFRGKARRMVKALSDLLERIEIMKSMIQKHCIKLSTMPNCITPKTAAVDSLFIVDSLLDDLQDLMNSKVELICDVKDQIRTLHEKLKFSRSFLQNINVPLQAEIEELKEPMVNIRDAAYEAEYLINSFVVGEVPIWYLTLRLSDVIHKTNLIETRLEEIKKKYDIGVPEVARHFDAQVSSQANRTLALDDIVVGFEYKENEILEKNEILEQLVRGVPKHLQIITILGMPGLGKTTLAKKLYNHPSVAYQFDICAWGVVSETYNRINLLIDLLSSLRKIHRDKILDTDGDSLGGQIYQILIGRRYLIVMDDIWDSTAWDDLRRYFPNNENGSRVLFTSRNKVVAPRDSIIHKLSLLSEDQCWELLKKKVFHKEACPPQLVGIGKQIAANCRGLPLTVVVIAGILATADKEQSVWEKVKGSLHSYMFANPDFNCEEILELSYKHLSDHLKPCFLYFGAFPEDTEISVKRLIPLWIAEGFIRKEEDKSPEIVAEEYLMELIDRSLVLVAKYTSAGGVKSCNIHDLLRDLCLRKVREENFLKLIKEDYSIYEKHHRLFVHPNFTRSFPPLPSSRPFGLHVRSFLGHLPYPSFCFPSMKLLRILDLLSMSVHMYHDLDEIRLLVHLRYLAVKDYIPASIGSLVNLEVLLVESTRGMVVITSILLKVVSLRHLHAGPKARFEEESSSLLNNLQTLSFVRISKLQDEEILRCSPHLRKLKCECGTLFPDLRFLVQLDTLKIQFKSCFSGELTEINFPINIKKLTLSNMGLPWEKMYIIGRLPNLEVLKLQYKAFVGERWETSDDEFQQLRFLKFESLELEEWNASSENFPRLRQLVLLACHNLLKIPSELGSISTLQVIDIQWCKNSLKESAVQIQEEQADNGNEEFKVIMRNIV